MSQASQPPASQRTRTAADLPGKVNLGSGEDYRPGWHNVDVHSSVQADEYADLDDIPWPWPDDTFEHALMDNVIEHLEDRNAALHELARIVEPGGSVVLRFPHWNSPGAHTNPTHTGTLTHRTLEYKRVSDRFEMRDIDCTRVRLGRGLPKTAALWLADHVGHIVSEVEVTAEVAE
jgi:SAM-dependent methyltransferase